MRPACLSLRRFSLFLALSALAHLLFYALFHVNREPRSPNPGASHKQSIEVSLSTLASPKSATKAAESKPQPPAKARQVEQAAAKPKPRRPPLAPPSPHPRRPAIAKPKPAKPAEDVQAFEDPFAERSHDYRRDAAAGHGPESRTEHSAAGDGGIHPGAILNINPRIVYPRHAQQQGLEGVVVVRIHIGTDGHCSGVDLLQSSGHQELDDQVLGSVQHWRFTPPMRGNTPVEGFYTHTVVFGTEERVDDFDRHWREIRVMPNLR